MVIFYTDCHSEPFLSLHFENPETKKCQFRGLRAIPNMKYTAPTNKKILKKALKNCPASNQIDLAKIAIEGLKFKFV